MVLLYIRLNQPDIAAAIELQVLSVDEAGLSAAQKGACRAKFFRRAEALRRQRVRHSAIRFLHADIAFLHHSLRHETLAIGIDTLGVGGFDMRMPTTTLCSRQILKTRLIHSRTVGYSILAR